MYAKGLAGCITQGGSLSVREAFCDLVTASTFDPASGEGMDARFWRRSANWFGSLPQRGCPNFGGRGGCVMPQAVVLCWLCRLPFVIYGRMNHQKSERWVSNLPEYLPAPFVHTATPRLKRGAPTARPGVVPCGHQALARSSSSYCAIGTRSPKRGEGPGGGDDMSTPPLPPNPTSVAQQCDW